MRPFPPKTRRLGVAFGVAVLATFAGAAPAPAKGPDIATICGASSCVTVVGPEKVNDLALFTAGFGTRAAPRPAPFFSVELTSSRQADVRWSFVYVPSSQAIKIIRADFTGLHGQETGPVWISPAARTLERYVDATKSLEPFPAHPNWLPPSATASLADYLRPLTVGLIGAAAIALLALVGRRSIRRVATSSGQIVRRTARPK